MQYYTKSVTDTESKTLIRLKENLNLRLNPHSWSCSPLGLALEQASALAVAKRDSANAVVLNLFHCWDPLNATDVVWDPQVKIEKVCAPE